MNDDNTIRIGHSWICALVEPQWLVLYALCLMVSTPTPSTPSDSALHAWWSSLTRTYLHGIVLDANVGEGESLLCVVWAGC